MKNILKKIIEMSNTIIAHNKIKYNIFFTKMWITQKKKISKNIFLQRIKNYLEIKSEKFFTKVALEKKLIRKQNPVASFATGSVLFSFKASYG